MKLKLSILAVLAVAAGVFYISREASPLPTAATTAVEVGHRSSSIATSESSSAPEATHAQAPNVVIAPVPAAPVVRKTVVEGVAADSQELLDPKTLGTVSKVSVADVFPGIQLPVGDWRSINPAQLSVVPFAGTSIPFDRVSMEQSGQRSTWVGKNAIQGASLVYCATGKMLDAVLTVPAGNQYSIHATNEGATIVESYDDRMKCGAMDVGSNDITIAPQIAADTTTTGPVFTMDILVVYTTASKGSFWGTTPEEVANKYASWCAAANVFYTNSLITNMKVNVVGAMEAVGYDSTKTTDMGDDLNEVSYAKVTVKGVNGAADTKRDSVIFASVDAKKKELKADFVQFIVDGTKNCAGIAWVGGDYSCIGTNVSPNTMAHELGHNMGCQHDRKTDKVDDNTTATGPYNYGFMYDGTLKIGNTTYKTTVGTIMSYAGNRLPYFSNPNVIYKDADPTIGDVALGVAIDQPKASYNAKTLTDMAVTNAAKVAGVNDPALTPITTDKASTSNLVYFGQSITMTEAAQGANLHYQWYKRTTENAVNTRTPIPNATASTYTISNFAVGDVAGYYVVVWNDKGAAQTAEIQTSGQNAPVVIPPVPSPSSGGSTGGGGGGGAPSDLFFVAIATAAVLRKFAKKK